MILKQYIPPAAEPIHLTEAKLHLKAGGVVDAAGAVEYTAEDSLLTTQIAASRDAAETEQWRALVLQTWDLYLDEFPGRNHIRLPLPPLRAVGFVKYTDSSGVSYDFTDYTVDLVGEPGGIVLNYGYTWPLATLAPNNPIQIRFQAGYLVPFTRSGATISILNNPFSVGDLVRLSVSGGSLPAPLTPLTDYYITATGLSLTSGGEDVVITTDGSGLFFIGELPASTVVGMKLVLTDLYENRGDTVLLMQQPYQLPRAAKHWFAMDSARHF